MKYTVQYQNPYDAQPAQWRKASSHRLESRAIVAAMRKRRTKTLIWTSTGYDWSIPVRVQNPDGSVRTVELPLPKRFAAMNAKHMAEKS